MANGFLGNFNPDALMAISAGLLTGQNPQEQLGNAVAGYANYRKDARQRNVTMDWLKKNSPDLIPMLDAGMSPGELVNAAYKRQQDQLKAQAPSRKFQTLDNGEYGYFDENAGSWTPLGSAPKSGSGDGEEWGLNPVWGKDKDGKVVLGQMSKSGRFKPLDTGDFTPTPGINNIDTGTEIITRNNRSGDTISVTPKDLTGAELQKGEGKNLADARAALPQVEATANELLSSIQSLENDPYLDSMVGSVDSWRPNLSSSAARVQSKMDQIGGQTFLQAFNQLRGAGQITEQEGAKATSAMARLNAAQNEADYRAALGELRGVVERAVENARQKAQGGGTTLQTQPRAGGGQQGGARTNNGVQWSVEP